jgi:hypothetical protein
MEYLQPFISKYLSLQSLYKSMITQRNVIMPVILYGCGTWYLISHITDITQTGSFKKQGTEENV